MNKKSQYIVNKYIRQLFATSFFSPKLVLPYNNLGNESYEQFRENQSIWWN